MLLILKNEPTAQFREIAKIFIASFPRPSFVEEVEEIIQYPTDKTTDKKLSANEKAIIDLIAANPSVTQKEIAVRMNLTEDGIYYHIVRLKAKGMLRRIGGKKDGRWEVQG